MNKILKISLLSFPLLLIAAAIAAIGSAYLAFSGGNYSGKNPPQEIIEQFCPAYIREHQARVLYISNIESMSGGQTTIRFELYPQHLEAFLQASPLKNTPLGSAPIAAEFTGSMGLPARQYSKAGKNPDRFQAATFYNGNTSYDIVIDKTDPKLFVVYFQSTS